MYRYTEEDKAIIAAARKGSKDKRAEKRLHALELRAAGKSAAEEASATGFHAAYISQLTAKYQRDGLEGIITVETGEIWQRKKKRRCWSHFERKPKWDRL